MALIAWYTKALANLVGGETAGETRAVDFLSDVIKVMLTTATHVPNQDTHEFKPDVTNEVVGTAYTAGGITLLNKTITVDGATNKITLDADDIAWTASTITARNAHIYDDTPALAADKPLIAYVDFQTDQVSANGALSIGWNAAGILTMTAAAPA